MTLYIRLNEVDDVETFDNTLTGVSYEFSTNEPNNKKVKSPTCKNLNQIKFTKIVLAVPISNYEKAFCKVVIIAHTIKKSIPIGQIVLPVRAFPENSYVKYPFHFQRMETERFPSSTIQFHYVTNGKKAFSGKEGQINKELVNQVIEDQNPFSPSRRDLLMTFRSIPPNLLPAFNDPELIAMALAKFT